MNRKIILLNVVLLGVVTYAGMMLRSEVRAANERAEKMRRAKTRITPPLPLAPLPVQPPVMATGYKDVAMKTLFHPSRNPDLPPPPPPPPPPPDPPMPPLPNYHGTMNIFGNGPQALLSLASVPTQAVSIGEAIGPFKLVDVNTVDITFDYQGKVVRRTLNQVMDRTVVAQGSGSGDGGGVRSVAPPPPPVVELATPKGPGAAFPNGGAACQPNDSSPAGTVQNGLRKVSVPTPFGNACRWDPVGR